MCKVLKMVANMTRMLVISQDGLLGIDVFTFSGTDDLVTFLVATCESLDPEIHNRTIGNTTSHDTMLRCAFELLALVMFLAGIYFQR